MRPIVRQVIHATVLAIAVLSVATAATAQSKRAGAKGVKWGPALDGFPPGAKMAIERGDPSKSGEFVLRLRFPAGYKIPPHWHPTDEHVRVVRGELLVGMGDTLDLSKTHKMVVGDSVSIGAKMHHFATAHTATEINLRAVGPFAITYVHPADDPRKKH